MTVEKKIITRYDPKPIPYRGCDWCAYYDGEEESGVMGWGATEAEALADLKMNLEVLS